VPDTHTDTSPIAMLRATEANRADLYNWARQVLSLPQLVPGIDWIGNDHHVWPYLIYRTRLNEANGQHSICATIAAIQSNQAPSRWIVEPGATPADLGDRLEANGFRRHYYLAGMAADLDQTRLDYPCSAEIMIRRVQSTGEMQHWAKAVNLGLYGGANINMGLLEKLLTDTRAQFYIALYGDTVVATAMQFLSAGVAGLYFIATLPDYRNRGIGKAITCAPLLYARKLGYHVSTLLASSMGERIYRQIGFEEYGRFHVYEWHS
jgi:GNAT superfamily N-acetyltransferase